MYTTGRSGTGGHAELSAVPLQLVEPHDGTFRPFSGEAVDVIDVERADDVPGRRNRSDGLIEGSCLARTRGPDQHDEAALRRHGRSHGSVVIARHIRRRGSRRVTVDFGKTNAQ